VGERAGYLTGTDILCDGGVLASGISPLRRRTGPQAPSDPAPRENDDRVLVG
jgi:hypothetical protein